MFLKTQQSHFKRCFADSAHTSRRGDVHARTVYDVITVRRRPAASVLFWCYDG